MSDRGEPPRPADRVREASLWGPIIAGALAGLASGAVLGFALEATRGWRRSPGWEIAYREFLAAGGWLWIVLWGASLALLLALPRTKRRGTRIGALALAIGFALLPLVARPQVARVREAAEPRTARGKSRAILKWSFGSPATVARILPLSHDSDPRVREQAVLALGVNLIVSDIEHASQERPSRYRDHPLRERLRARLLQAMREDPDPAVRTEAARALWKAPAAFGRDPAAAETLSAALDRVHRARSNDRLAWLALDAAAGTADSGLIAAARRFAAATPDSELARAARIATRERAP